MKGMLRLDVCCNDHSDGGFRSRALAISLPDYLLELASADMRGPVFRDLDHSIRLGRRMFPIERSKEWYSNWEWNAYWLTPAHGIELVAWLHTQGSFVLDGGATWLFDRWKRARPFDADDRDRLGRAWARATAESRP